MNEAVKFCKNCGEKLLGRKGKKFCSTYCKSNFHYILKKASEERSFFRKVDLQLKRNRRILKDFNKAGKSVVRQSVLLKEGFNPNFFTHYWKNQKGDVYLFVYEFGFLRKKEGEKYKFILVTWQKYMGVGVGRL